MTAQGEITSVAFSVLPFSSRLLGLSGRNDGAQEEQSGKDAGKAQAEAPPPGIVLHTWTLMHLSESHKQPTVLLNVTMEASCLQALPALLLSFLLCSFLLLPSNCK